MNFASICRLVLVLELELVLELVLVAAICTQGCATQQPRCRR